MHARVMLVVETNGKDKGEMNHTISGFIHNVLKGFIIPDFQNITENDMHKIEGVAWTWEDDTLKPKIPLAAKKEEEQNEGAT